MSRRLSFALCLLLAFWLAVASAAEHPFPNAKSPPIACTIRSEPTCALGKTPKIAVEIANWTGEAIHLVHVLDGSDCKWRYPLCYFEVVGPNGEPVTRKLARCGNMNPLVESDIVPVPRGGKLDLGAAPSYQLAPGLFAVAGDYRIRFVYSTDSPKIESWLGDGKPSDKLAALLALVPKATVSSNEITVKVVGE